MGSVFSPYYAMARRRGRPDPLHHCAVNVALYGMSGPSWSCTERGRASLQRTASSLAVGPTSLAWVDDVLEIRIAEVTAPIPRRLRGIVRIQPLALADQVFDLDRQGRHRWWPVSPCARAEVEFDAPGLRWSGHAYLDSNDGDEPLAEAFTHWNWSRATLSGGSAVLYDVVRRGGERASVALRFGQDRAVSEMELPPARTLPRSRWRLERETRSEAPGPAIRQSLEDGPFYARSLVGQRLCGQDVVGVHETVSLDRFRMPWVQALLPFRMPRRAG